ncbi:MAG: hypothetical protein AAGC78_15830 [Cellvibrio sp.]|uniref:hypothetical protein n=1 Tax=Cellvibrio sp. TaxID=1965322 RepID=UPI0031A71850
MHKIHHWAVRCLAASSLAIALPASAYLQFTYTSQPLPLTSYLIEGYPQDINEVPLPPPAFSISFSAQEPDAARSAANAYFAKDLTFSLISPDAEYINYPILLDPASYGQVTLGADGAVAGWDLMLQITELITPETDLLFHKMNDHHVNVVSNSERGDQVVNRFHPITWHGEWIQLAQLEFTFADMKNRGSWTVEKVELPEPGLAWLLATGLTALLWSRRRHKSVFGREKICLKSAN